MSQELIADLRNRLARLRGPARLPDLLRLGQVLGMEYSTAGPGLPAARPYLDGSIEALGEALGYLDPGDAVVGTITLSLGSSLAARYGAHGGADADCAKGIELLETALSFPGQNRTNRARARTSLAQAYLARVTAHLQTAGFSVQARSGGTASAQALADLDRGAACCQAILDDDPVSDELTSIARTLLDTSNAMRPLLHSDLASFDVDNLDGMLTLVQRLQDQRGQGADPSSYRLPVTNLLGMPAEAMSSLDPTLRPVTVSQGRPVLAEPPPDRPAPPAPPDENDLRRALHALLPPPAGEPAWRSAATLLRPDAATPDAVTVDDMVALASTLVDQPPDDPAQAALDAYLLAVALLLRNRLDGTADATDRRAGAEQLLAAARQIPLDHPATITILRSLGAFLTETDPLDDVLAPVAAGYATRLDAAIATGIRKPADLVTLHALRCLCRATEALTDLTTATGTVPPDYPWLSALKTAAGTVTGRWDR